MPDANQDINSAADHLTFCRARGASRWLPTAAEYPNWPGLSVAEAAEKALRHMFRDPYDPNASEYHLGTPIDWRRTPFPPGDPRHAPALISTLSRHLWWRDLADAYRLTGDEQHAREWAEQLLSWIAACPPPEPPDIWDPQEVWRGLNLGVRMFDSWPHAYFAFLDSPCMTPEVHEAYCTSVRRHAADLHAMTVGCPGQTGNWVGLQCRGLATVALLFPEWPESDEWFATAAARMEAELHEGTWPDGGQKELSPAYHHIAFRDFFETLRLAEHNGRSMPPGFREQLQRMFRWMEALATPEGKLPPLGDSLRMDIAATLDAGRNVFGPAASRDAFVAFPNSGYFVMRSPNVHAVFDAGPLGQAHWHEDCLSLYVEAFGRPLLTDPGKHAYDASEWRHYILGTPAHNTVTVDGMWQRRGARGGAPGPTAETAHAHLFQKVGDCVWISGRYTGPYCHVRHEPTPYHPCADQEPAELQVAHTRHVLFVPWLEGFVVVDELMAPSDRERLFEVRWHLAVAEVSLENERCLGRDADGSGAVIINLTPAASSSVVCGRRDPSLLGWLPAESPPRPIPVLIHARAVRGGTTLGCLILPFASERQIPRGSAALDAGSRILTLSSPRGVTALPLPPSAWAWDAVS